MSVIVISAGPYSGTRELAVKTAQILGYECAGPEVLELASQDYGVPQEKLAKAFKDLSRLGSFNKSGVRHLAYLHAALMRVLQKDRMVVHGLAASIQVGGVSHLVKVRVNASLEVRVQRMVEREPVTPAAARKLILDEDSLRQRWSLAVYRRDENDPEFYDLVVDLTHQTLEEAAEAIARLARQKKFQPMTYSLDALADQELASRVRAALIDLDPEIQVRTNRGVVHVLTTGLKREEKKKAEAIKKRLADMPGVQRLEVQVIVDFLRQAMDTLR